MNKTIETIRRSWVASLSTLADAFVAFRVATVKAINDLKAEGVDTVTIRELLRAWSDEVGKDRTYINRILSGELGNERKRAKSAMELGDATETESAVFDDVLAMFSAENVPSGDSKKKSIPFDAERLAKLVMRHVKSAPKAITLLKKAERLIENAWKD